MSGYQSPGYRVTKIKEARETIEQHLQELLEEMRQGKSESLLRYLNFCAQFHRYSFGNIVLALSQRPNITRLAGLKQWNKVGRHVRAGEKGIMILAPITVKRRSANTLNAALQSGGIEEIRVDAVEELATFARLMESGRLGAGECAAIAAAAHRGYALAVDDKAARKAALSLLSSTCLLNTQALMVSLITIGVLSVEEADAIKADWETKHSFALRIRSFRDLL